jgi:hypothetical protein
LSKTFRPHEKDRKKDDERVMAPVFTYRWQLWLLVAFVAFFAMFPLVPKPDWMSRDILYRSFKYIDTQKARITSTLLTERGDIDMLFLGTSATGSAIELNILRSALRPILGREPVIYTIAHPITGYDYDFVLLKDLLKVRKVKLLFWETSALQLNNQPYPYVRYVWDYAEHYDLLEKAPSDKIAYYLQSMMNCPKLLLSPILDRKPGFIEDTLCDRYYNDGMCLRNLVYNSKAPLPDLPEPPKLNYADLVHTRDSWDSSLVVNGPYPPYDYYFFTQTVLLLQSYNVAVYLLEPPKLETPHKKINILSLPSNHPAMRIPYFTVIKDYLLPPSVSEWGFMTDNTHMPYTSTAYYTRAILPTVADLVRMHIIEEEAKPDEAGENLRPGLVEWPEDLALPDEVNLPSDEELQEHLEQIEHE